MCDFFYFIISVFIISLVYPFYLLRNYLFSLFANRKVLHTINCPVCGKNNSNVFYNIKCERLKDVPFSEYLADQLFTGRICTNCTLFYISPVIEQKKLDNYYRSLEVEENQDEELYLPIIDLILQYKKSGNLLDVGFGSGTILKLAKEFGFTPYGVEINKNSITMMRNKGYEVYEGNFLDILLPENYFDIITFLSVIEHIEDMSSVLTKAYRLLKKDGIIAATLPNFSLSAKILKENWLYLSPYIGHIYCFTPRSITKVLRKYKFEILTLRISQLSPDLILPQINNVYLNFVKFLLSNMNYTPFSYIRRFMKVGDAIFVIAKK